MTKISKWGRNNLPLILITGILLVGMVYLFPNGIDPRIQRHLNLNSAILMGLGLFISLRLSGPVGVLVLYLSVLCFIYPHYSMEINSYTIYALFFVFVSMTYKDWKDRIHVFYDVICFVALLNVAWQILQYFGVYILISPKGGGSISSGLMSNINETSALLALCLPAFFRDKRWFFIPIIMVGIWLSASMVGWASSVIILSVYVINKWRFRIGLLCFLFILTFLFATYSDHFSLKSQRDVRFNVYLSIAGLSLFEPMGYGLGQFKHIFPLVTSYKYLTQNDKQILMSGVTNKNKLNKALTLVSGGDIGYFAEDRPVFKNAYFQAHNEYLEFWFEAGIIGLILLIYALITQIINARKIGISFYGLLAAGLTSCVFFTWHFAPMAVITVLYAGISTGENINGNQRIL